MIRRILSAIRNLWNWTPALLLDDRGIREWLALNPGRCMYCSYTRRANTEQGQSLKLEPHNCPESNEPPAPLPVARIRR